MKIFLSRILLAFICVSIVFGNTSNISMAASPNEIKMHNGVTGAPTPYYGKDFSKLDLKDKYDLLTHISFDNYTKWPSKDKLPVNFDPKKVLEWGMNPGLGLNELHKQGFTGKGVNVAYVDQSLLPGHVEYDRSNIKYFVTDEKYPEPSMHGPAVLSILAGENVGVAPDSTVYYFASADGIIQTKEPNGQAIYTAKSIAKGILKAVEVNKTLPDDQKIRVLGISFGSKQKEYIEAKNIAERNGIMVFDVDTLNGFSSVSIKPNYDKDDYKNYFLTYWCSPQDLNANEALFCPTGGETIASGISFTNDPKNDYIYWEGGGLSWAVPYLEGVVALGLQIDPSLTKNQIVKYLYDSAYQFGNVRYGGIINPKGFLDLVRKNAANMVFDNVPQDKDFYYFLYNSNNLNKEDLNSIKDYASRFEQDVYLKDVSFYVTYTKNDLGTKGQIVTNAAFKGIYEDLKNDCNTKTGILKGIQIFGSIEDVPPYSIDSSLKNTKKNIDEMGIVSTDLFYANFNNEASFFSHTIKTYKIFDGTMTVDLNPQWKVARLPLKSGEYKGYFDKYYSYNKQVKAQDIVPVVNFNNPIFPASNHIDDTAYFLNRLYKEFYILDKTYRLYGNLDGKYPVGTKVLGNFNRENLIKENSTGIVDFFFETHGQSNNIDQAVFDQNNKEKRISLVNNNNINSVLSKNFYTLNLWTCNNAWSLRNDTLVHEVLAKGKCIGAIAASSTISNRGIDNGASLEKMKENNYFYFQLLYYQNLALNNSRTDSFFNAQKGYISRILKHKVKLSSGYYDYQFNIHNAMSVHYLGLIESEYSSKRFMDFSKTKDSLTDIEALVQQKLDFVKKIYYKDTGKKITLYVEYSCKHANTELCILDVVNQIEKRKIQFFKVINGKGTYKCEIDKAVFEKTETLTFSELDNMGRPIQSITILVDDIEKK